MLSVGSVVSRDNIEALAVFLGVEFDLAVLPIESRLRAAKLDKACLFLDVRRPAELYLELRPVIEAYSAHRKILNVKRAVLDLVAEVGVHGVADVVVGELAVCAAGHGDWSRAAHEPYRKVYHVNAEVNERAAAGLRLGGEPAALSGNSASPLPAAASAVYLAHFAVVNELLRKLRRVGEAVVSHDHERLARSLSGVIHLHDLFDIDGIRLLAENVLARLESGNRDYRVEIVRGADIDRVYRLVLEQLVEIGIYLRVGEKTVAALDRPLLDYVAERDNLKAIVFKIVLAVSAVEYSADTDNTYSPFFHRKTSKNVFHTN